MLNKNKKGKKATEINLDDYYGIKEVAGVFGVKDRTIFNWRCQQKLVETAYKRYVLFLKSIVDVQAERYKRLGFF